MGSPLGDRQIDFRESHLFIGAAIGELIGELLTSAVKDEHLDFTDRGHGELARLVGQQVVSLDHALVQAGPVG